MEFARNGTLAGTFFVVLFPLDVFSLFIQSNLKLDYSLTTKLSPMVKYTVCITTGKIQMDFTFFCAFFRCREYMMCEKIQQHIIRMSVIVLDRIMNDGSPLSVSLIKLARQTYGLLYILWKLIFDAQIHTHTHKKKHRYPAHTICTTGFCLYNTLNHH